MTPVLKERDNAVRIALGAAAGAIASKSAH